MADPYSPVESPIFMNVLVERFRGRYWGLDTVEKSEMSASLFSLLKKPGTDVISARAYLSPREDSDLILWYSTRTPEASVGFKMKIRSVLAEQTEPVYSMLSIYEDSPYLKGEGNLENTLKQDPQRYFVCYPMSKSVEWYLLDFTERKRIMANHIGMALSHPENKGIRSYTTYSFGISDQEFVVLYETDNLVAWSHVTQKLREAEARKWIVKEEPIFVGILCTSLP